MDRIIDESQVAKATFYKHFSSKENLVIACNVSKMRFESV
ncbi:helix-turn-helix domain-containing protein [Acinetobacter baumannii]